jgi:hypothetical protein
MGANNMPNPAQPWTVQQDGYMSVYATHTAGSSFIVRVNGAYVSGASVINGGDYANSCFAPVSAEDTVSYHNNGGTITHSQGLFCPPKKNAGSIATVICITY